MDDFDWVFYTRFYPDISACIKTAEKAREHYKSLGSKEIEQRWSHFDLNQIKCDKYGTSYLVDNTDFFYGIDSSVIRSLIKDTRLTNESKVLEVNCGIACHALPLIKFLSTGFYLGLDRDPLNVEWAQQHIANPSKKVSFQVLETEETTEDPFSSIESEQFDLIFDTRSMCNRPFNQFVHQLGHVSRLLKKGGHLIYLGFIWNNTLMGPIPRKKGLKTEMKNGHIVMTNPHKEQVIVQSDEFLYTHFEKNQLELKDVFYGRWSETSENHLYQDFIHLSKLSFDVL